MLLPNMKQQVNAFLYSSDPDLVSTLEPGKISFMTLKINETKKILILNCSYIVIILNLSHINLWS